MTWPGWSEKCALCEVLNHWGTNGWVWRGLECAETATPVHQDLADLDALAASAQSILHALPAADDGHAAQLLGKVNANVRMPRPGHHALLCEREVSQAVLHHLRANIGRCQKVQLTKPP